MDLENLITASKYYGWLLLRNRAIRIRSPAEAKGFFL
jgi:hypothetical protein